MFVEAQHMNLFPSQLIEHRDFVKNTNQGNYTITNQMDCGIISSLAGTNTMPEQLFAFNNQSNGYGPISAKISINKADSGLTHNFNPTATRKRVRDSSNDFEGYTDFSNDRNQKQRISSGNSLLLDDDVVFQIRQQQFEIDRYIIEHTEKVRLEIEEKRKRQSRATMNAIQELILKKLNEKDEEIQRFGKLNWMLQERLKSLYMENQIWRDLAQTNEATAITLRSNLEQVLARAYVCDDNPQGGVADDAESSCCGSNDCEGDKEEVEFPTTSEIGGGAVNGGGGGGGGHCVGGGGKNMWMCKKCGERESSVLLLPCRHLCLCTFCGTTLLQACPVLNRLGLNVSKSGQTVFLDERKYWVGFFFLALKVSTLQVARRGDTRGQRYDMR